MDDDRLIEILRNGNNFYLDSYVGTVALVEGKCPKLTNTPYTGKIITFTKRVKVQTVDAQWCIITKFTEPTREYSSNLEDTVKIVEGHLLREDPTTYFNMELIEKLLRGQKVTKKDKIKKENIDETPVSKPSGSRCDFLV